MEVTTLRASEAWRTAVDIAARLRGVTRSEYVRQAVRESVERDLVHAEVQREPVAPTCTTPLRRR